MTALHTPATQLSVVPSPSTIPNCAFVPFWIAGAASDLMNVVADPLTADGPAVADGLPPPGVLIVPDPVIGFDAEQVIPVPQVMLVTVPAPATAHIPSPRQNVEDDALNPEFRLLTDRFPVTPVDNGRPVIFVSVPFEGVPSAPPLITSEPTVPTLTPRAVAAPVPRPETPVEIGRPVTFVRVPD